MDPKSFLLFIVIAIIIELLLIIPTRIKANRYIHTRHNIYEDTVQAIRVKSSGYNSYDNHCYSEYEWVYNGKKHRHIFADINYESIVVTVDKRTGKFIESAKMKAKKSIILAYFFVSVALSLIITTIVCGLKII